MVKTSGSAQSIDEIANCIWVKLFGGGGGGKLSNVSVLIYLLVKGIFFHFELKLEVYFKTKAVSNRIICFIKAVLLLGELI